MINKNIFYNPLKLNKKEIIELEKSIKNMEWYFTDTRDGAQNAFFSASIDNQKKVIFLLSKYIKSINGIIEGGYAGATGYEQEKYDYIIKNNLNIAVFGSSKIVSKNVEDHFLPIIESKADIVTIFVKCSISQVTNVLKIDLEENLKLIKESIKYLKNQNKYVIIDLEHFFDGYIEDKKYVKKCMEICLEGGGDKLVLCDTLGKTPPNIIREIILEITNKSKNPNLTNKLKNKLGLHLHEDKYYTIESIIKSLATGKISHIQGNFSYCGERIGNTPLSLLFTKLYEEYDIDIFKGNKDRNLLWKNLLSTYSQVSFLLNGKFPGKIDNILNPENYYHGAGMHVGALGKDSNSYSIVSEKLIQDLDIQNYPGLTKQAGKINVLYYLEQAFDLEQSTLEDKKHLFTQSLEILKKHNSINYTDSIATFLLEVYKIKNNLDGSLQKIINDDFGIKEIKSTMQIDENGKHIGTTLEINMKNENHKLECLIDDEKINGIFHSIVKLLSKKLEPKYPYIKNLELLSYSSNAKTNNSDAKVNTKLVFKDKKSTMLFSVISENNNADIASINAIKQAFYYFVLCKRGEIIHYQDKLLETRYGEIVW
ncbi:MAG: hypothetical protein WC850_03405 [Candidatus Gracilibacteria bacterium]